MRGLDWQEHGEPSYGETSRINVVARTKCGPIKSTISESDSDGICSCITSHDPRWRDNAIYGVWHSIYIVDRYTSPLR